jgi:hypothetical protein
MLLPYMQKRVDSIQNEIKQLKSNPAALQSFVINDSVLSNANNTSNVQNNNDYLIDEFDKKSRYHKLSEILKRRAQYYNLFTYLNTYYKETR